MSEEKKDYIDLNSLGRAVDLAYCQGTLNHRAYSLLRSNKYKEPSKNYNPFCIFMIDRLDLLQLRNIGKHTVDMVFTFFENIGLKESDIKNVPDELKEQVENFFNAQYDYDQVKDGPSIYKNLSNRTIHDSDWEDLEVIYANAPDEDKAKIAELIKKVEDWKEEKPKLEKIYQEAKEKFVASQWRLDLKTREFYRGADSNRVANRVEQVAQAVAEPSQGPSLNIEIMLKSPLPENLDQMDAAEIFDFLLKNRISPQKDAFGPLPVQTAKINMAFFARDMDKHLLLEKVDMGIENS